MMSASGLTVRCLASTRVAEARQETDQSGQHHVLSGDEHDAETQGGNGSRGGEESGDGGASALPQDEIVDHLHHERAATPASSRLSDSSDEDESESDSSDASSGISQIASPGTSTSCIQEAQLSPDGTCIFTSDYDRAFSVYPISTDKFESTAPRPLKVYSQFKSADPIWAFAANPFFNLQDSNTTHVLVSRRDRYITLHNALWDTSSSAPVLPTTSSISIHTPLTSYKLINHLTEAVTAPLSLAYSNSGTHFFAGTQNSISIFDLAHTSDPISSIVTIPSARTKLKGGGRGFKGHISALAVSPPTAASAEGLLAAGSRTRHVGLYDALSGADVTHISLSGTAHVGGDGVSSLKWSPCGRYLYVAERDSDALLIYDVRSFSMALGYCVGRRARTKQKLGFDVWNAGASPYDIEGIAHEVWAGGTDGRIRVWKDPYTKQGAIEADEVVNISGEEMPVVSTLVHTSGSLAIAARGLLTIGDDTPRLGTKRGGGRRPRFSEEGSLDILGLSSC